MTLIRGRAEGMLSLLVPLLALGYAGLILVDVHLSPIDDHDFIATTLAGNWLTLDIDPSEGRFDPLTGQEVNLVALVSNTPFSYYAFNSVELLLFAGLFADLMRRFASRNQALATVLLLLALPGFASAWFRLEVSERDSLVLFAVFLWSYWRFEAGRSCGYAVLALLAANLALYYKETSFILLGSFCLARLAAARSGGEPKTSRLDAVLLLSAALYVGLYYALIYRHWGPVLYGASPVNPVLRAAKNLSAYATWDPFLVFLSAPLAAWRLGSVLLKRAPLDPIGDPLLVAAIAYALAYIVLNIAEDYYWLPAYAFALPGVFYWARQPQIATGRAWAIGSGLTLVFLVTGSIPTTLANIADYKYEPRNFNAMIAFLKADISARPADEPVNLYLDGVSADGELYVSLARFLVYAGLPADRFDLRSERPPNNVSRLGEWADKVHRSYSAFQSVTPSHPGTGDYLIVPPYGGRRLDADGLASLDRDYRLVFRTLSPLGIPNLSVRAILRELANGHVPAAQLDYAIFVKR